MSDIQNIAANAAGYFATSTGLLCCHRIFAVACASGHDLSLYIVNADHTSFACGQQRCLHNMGVDPLVRSIAERIVGTVNMASRVIPQQDAAGLDSEIRRHFDKAAKVVAYIEKNPDKDSLRLNTNFESAPGQSFPVAISIPEVRGMAANYSSQYVPLFSEFLASCNIRTIDLEKIILVGDLFASDEIYGGFLSLGTDSVIRYTGPEIASIEAWTPPSPDDEITQFEVAKHETVSPKEIIAPPAPPVPPTPPEIPAEPQYMEVSRLDILQLTCGAMVWLDTFDSTPGKGAAYQELEYIGDGLFRVTSSGRTLLPGDIAKPYVPLWLPGVQVDLEITRGPKPMGRFRTRVVKHIKVKK